MKMLNLKAIGIGAAAFAVLYPTYSFIRGFDPEPNFGAATYLLLYFTYLFPGFLAGAISKRHGVINGAMVGLIAGLAALVFFLFPFDGSTSGAIGAASFFGIAAIFSTSFGGLLWHLYSALSRLLRSKP